MDVNSKVPTTLLGKRVSKRFHDGIYVSTITDVHTDDDYKPLWHVCYNDSVSKDLDLNEICDAVKFHSIYPHEHCFHSPTDLLNNTDTTPSMDKGAPATTNPMALATQPNAATDQTEQAPPTDNNPAPNVDTATNLQQSNCIQIKAASSSGKSLFCKAGICFLTTCGSLLHTTTHHTSPKLISEQEINAIFPPPYNDNSIIHTALIEHKEQLRAYHSHCQQLHNMFAPDSDLIQEQSLEILCHYNVCRHSDYEHPRQVYFSVAWKDVVRPNQIISLDDLCTDEPWMCIRYANQHNLMKQPEWEWIPPYIESDLTLMDMIHTYRMSVLKGNTYQFDVQVPGSPKHALVLDDKNKNNLWQCAIDMELHQILHEFPAFHVLDNDEPLPPGYCRVPYHMMFAIKVNLQRKARLVIDENRSPPVPKEDCFAPTISLDSVHLGFLLAQMRGLECVAADIGSAYLSSFSSKQLYIIAGKEFGPEFAGKHLLIDKAVYGTRTGSACFHKSLSLKLHHFHFKPSLVDLDLWMQKPKGGGYKYIAQFVDNVMAFSLPHRKSWTI